MTNAAVDAAAALLGALAERDSPLGARTTYRVGGNASLLVVAHTATDLRRVRTAVIETNLDVLVVGRGSNLLISDAGFVGIAVVLGDGFGDIVIDDEGRVTAGGAVALPVLARAASAAGCGGLEWAVGVPGSVGGAVRMNAGGHGSDIAGSLTAWESVDLRGGPDGVATLADLAPSYRHTSVRAAQVVTTATFATSPVDAAEAEATMRGIVTWRRENQPGGQNAGSVFTNPVGDSAGRVIEAAGLKGLRVGTAEVSTKHANFIQADPGGSAADVYALIREVQKRLREDHDVVLHTEIRMIGFPS